MYMNVFSIICKIYSRRVCVRNTTNSRTKGTDKPETSLTVNGKKEN